MSPERLRRVQELFEEALRRPGAERHVFLGEACGSDKELLEEIRCLLESDGTTISWSSIAFDRGGPLSKKREESGKLSTWPRIEDYEIVAEVGKGGMGVVYKARDPRLDRFVALKTVLGENRTADRLRLLRREAQLAARLRHQNIVAVHEFIESSDPPTLAMEWIDGIPLDVACRGLGIREIVCLFLKVVRATAYAHNMGVIHRDIKPGNILVDRAGEPRLLDFGLAKAAVFSAETSSAECLKGTPLFMAPEQFAAPAEAGSGADVFALGLVLFTVLTGLTPPPPTAGSAARLSDWAAREIPLPRSVNPDIPEALQRICLKACEHRIGDRYVTAAHLADDLQRFLEGRLVLARPSRYARLLETKVAEHIEDLAGWCDEQLITRRDADSLHERYFKLIEMPFPATPGAHLLRNEMIMMQLGGSFVVVAALLWSSVYWEQLDSLQRVCAVGLPTLAISALAAILWQRSHQRSALLCSATGAVLLPLLLLTLFSETRFLAQRTPEDLDYELFPPIYFSNLQLVASFLVATLYVAILNCRRRYALLTMVLCGLFLLAFCSTLLLIGLKQWILQGRYALAAAWLSSVPVLYYLLGRALDQPRTETLAIPPYAAGAVGFLIVLAALCYDAPESWLELEPAETPDQIDWQSLTRNLFFVSAGLLCLLIAWMHDRGSTRLRRLWGRMYFKVVPPALVIPADLIAQQPIWSIGRVGEAELQVLSLSVPVLCISLIWLGWSVQLRWFTIYGIIHLSVFLFRFSDRHFHQFAWWPLAIATTGAVAIGAGLMMESYRAKMLKLATPTA